MHPKVEGLESSSELAPSLPSLTAHSSYPPTFPLPKHLNLERYYQGSTQPAVCQEPARCT